MMWIHCSMCHLWKRVSLFRHRRTMEGFCYTLIPITGCFLLIPAMRTYGCTILLRVRHILLMLSTATNRRAIIRGVPIRDGLSFVADVTMVFIVVFSLPILTKMAMQARPLFFRSAIHWSIIRVHIMRIMCQSLSYVRLNIQHKKHLVNSFMTSVKA